MHRLGSIIDVDEGFYQMPTLSTAGAVSVRDEKGRFVTKKVKVNRYVAGKRPDYAGDTDENSSESDIDGIQDALRQSHEIVIQQPLTEDRRLERIKGVIGRRRERQVDNDEDINELQQEENKAQEEEITARRAALRERLVNEDDEFELLKRENEPIEDEESEDESEDDTESDESEVNDTPRLKPVFVKRENRLTSAIDEEAIERQKMAESRKKAEEKKRETMKLLEEAIRKERQEKNDQEIGRSNVLDGSNIKTDDEENDIVEYEKWKLRELKRMKRNQEQILEREKERQEAERNRLLADTGRLDELRNKQRHVINKEIKGKYKFLQKYYHRGAFYLDKEQSVFVRDFSTPTLEDHFDKTVLPKVMQVKKFGLSGRTKYTHLVDQDTTCFEAPYAMDKTHLLRFHNSKGGGMKQTFENPSMKRYSNN